MELGGNISDDDIQDLLIASGKSTTETETPKK